MKLYHEAETGWIVPGQQGRKATRVDVPTSPPEALADWLNARRVGVEPGAAEAEPASTVLDPSPEAPQEPARAAPSDNCPACHRNDRAALKIAQSGDIDALAGWLMTAQPWQVERLFEALGARFAELRP